MDTMHSNVAEMQEALPEKNFDIICRHGHSQKGLGSTYGFDYLSHIGYKIETAGMQKNVEEVQKLLKEMSQVSRKCSYCGAERMSMYNQDVESFVDQYVTRMPISVLLIDDEFLIGEAMRIKLSSETDIIFNYCKEPDKALETAIGVQPTVIMLDLVMPGVNGLTMVKFFKSSEDFRDVPLIVLSAREEPELKKKAIALGANDYMIKLPDKTDLIARIRCHSERYIFKQQRDELIMKLKALSGQGNGGIRLPISGLIPWCGWLFHGAGFLTSRPRFLFTQVRQAKARLYAQVQADRHQEYFPGGAGL
jgi:DNA-binding NarL/FixJ family response regulator/HPt (histidine-containing phosphotransfer) domain-containing protein